MNNKLIVGLGNPGKQYEKTRHNVGFMVLDDLVTHLGNNIKPEFKNHKKSDSEIAELDNLILAKPQTFMNNSGIAVKKLISYFNVTDGDVLIIYDDVDLPIGEVHVLGKFSASEMKSTKDKFLEVRETVAKFISENGA